MIEKLQMSQEEKERVENILLQENELQKEKKKFGPARRLAAAVLAVCLITGVGATAYGAAHDHWFSMFLGGRTAEKQTDQKSMSGKQDTSNKLLQKLSQKGDIKTQIKEKNGYQVEILSNVYSWKQNMGLLVCSFRFKNGDTSYIDVSNPDRSPKADKTMALTAEGAVDYLTYDKQGMGDFLVFSVTGGQDTSKNVKDSTQIYYDGEQDTDGLQRYRAQAGFRVLIDSSKIKYIRVLGQKYIKQ